MIEEKDGYKVCILCTKEKKNRNFYIHRSEIMPQHLSVCKACIDKINSDENNGDIFRQLLGVMNIPYKQEVVDNYFNSEKIENPVASYIGIMNSLKQNREMKFKDSDFFNIKIEKHLDEERKFKSDKASNLDAGDMYAKWGIDVEMEEYEKLESIFARDGGNEAFDEMEEAMYITLAINKYLRNKAIEDGDSKRIESFQKLAQNSQKDLNALKESKNIGEETFGMFIKKVEDDEPLDIHPERWDSKWLKYLYRWVIVQYKRIRGEIRDEDIELLEDEDDFRGL